MGTQIAARKRCKRHMTETDEYLSNGGDGFLMDSLSMGTAYAKMKTLCMHISSEVRVDIEIHNKHVLPRSDTAMLHSILATFSEYRWDL